jgi:hypothetical protein
MAYLVPYDFRNAIVGKLGLATDQFQRWFTTFLASVNPTAGIESGAYTDAPTGLGTANAGRMFYVTSPYFHLIVWDGTAWQFADGGNKFIADFPAAPTAGGWSACNGTPTDYLVLGATLSIAALTPVNPANHYRKSVAAGANTVAAAVAPGISGTTGSTTPTNQAATATNIAATAVNNAASAGITVDTHPDHKHEDVTDDGAAKLFTEDLILGKSARTGIQVTTAFAALTLSHNVNDPTHNHNQNSHNHTQNSHNHTQDAHLHAIGTIAVDATGEPGAYNVLTFFRR